MGRLDIHYAALEGRLDDLHAALARGETPDTEDEAGFTPLHFAAQQGQADAVEVLLAAGAPLEARNKYGNSPLWVAVMNQRVGQGQRVTSLLLAAGASVDSANLSNVSVRDVADRMGARLD